MNAADSDAENEIAREWMTAVRDDDDAAGSCPSEISRSVMVVDGPSALTGDEMGVPQ